MKRNKRESRETSPLSFMEYGKCPSSNFWEFFFKRFKLDGKIKWLRWRLYGLFQIGCQINYTSATEQWVEKVSQERTLYIMTVSGIIKSIDNDNFTSSFVTVQKAPAASLLLLQLLLYLSPLRRACTEFNCVSFVNAKSPDHVRSFLSLCPPFAL